MSRVRLVVASLVLGLTMAVQPVVSSAEPRPYEGTARGTSMPTSRAETMAVALNFPVAIWQLPGSSYDGIGSWMIPGNVPTAGAGQLPPLYAAAHQFSFVNHPDADALLALTIDGTDRAVELIVFGDAGRRTSVLMPYNWVANQWYFPFIYTAGSGVWAVFVYDLTAGAATHIGSVALPADWGGIAPQSYLHVSWYGEDAGVCSAYPRFDVYRLSPTGFIGQASTQSTFLGYDSVPGPCTGTVAAQPTAAWSHFVIGG